MNIYIGIMFGLCGLHINVLPQMCRVLWCLKIYQSFLIV